MNNISDYEATMWFLYEYVVRKNIQCCQNRDLGAQLGYFSLFLPRLASISGSIEING